MQLRYWLTYVRGFPYNTQFNKPFLYQLYLVQPGVIPLFFVFGAFELESVPKVFANAEIQRNALWSVVECCFSLLLGTLAVWRVGCGDIGCLGEVRARVPS